MEYLKCFENFISDKFHEWFNNSVFYHGSDYEFDVFNKKNQGGGFLGYGFYFTPVKELAKTYGDIIYRVKLKTKKPLFMNGVDTIFSDDEILKIANMIHDELFIYESKTQFVNRILSIENYYRKHDEFVKSILAIDKSDINVFEKIGFDSIIGKEIDEIVIWNPKNIKIIGIEN